MKTLITLAILALSSPAMHGAAAAGKPAPDVRVYGIGQDGAPDMAVAKAQNDASKRCVAVARWPLLSTSDALVSVQVTRSP